jgi:hypothetical protein
LVAGSVSSQYVTHKNLRPEWAACVLSADFIETAHSGRNWIFGINPTRRVGLPRDGSFGADTQILHLIRT